jgi:hypothetical protein
MNQVQGWARSIVTVHNVNSADIDGPDVERRGGGRILTRPRPFPLFI